MYFTIQIGSETNPGMFTMNSIIDGVLYAVNNGADVINLSIQSIYPDEAKRITEQQLNEMIKDMSRDDELFWNELFKISNDSNISIVFAAGNYDVLIGLDAMKRYDNIITVSMLIRKKKELTLVIMVKDQLLAHLVLIYGVVNQVVVLS